MPRYSYVAKDMDGIVHKGTLEVPDKSTLRMRLKRDALFLISIKTVRALGSSEFQFFNTIKSKEIAEFAEQFAIMTEAGLSLIMCLETLIANSKNQKLKRIIEEIKLDVENGSTLANALSKHPKVFSKLFVSIVKAGEVGGTLPKSLRQIANNLDKEEDARQKIKSALAYPKLVGAACFLVIIFILTYIIPRFAQIYDSLKIELPYITIMLVDVSRLIFRYWWVILIFILMTVFGYYMFKRSGSTAIDKFKLSMPVFGDLFRKSIISRFVYVLSSLHGSGVPILQALEVAQEVINNKIISHIIDVARLNVNAGGKIKDAISVSKLFPVIVVQMISVGEETGELSPALEKSAIYLEREVDAVIKRLITKVEPGLTIIIGIIVALIAAAVYLPIFDVVKVVQK